MINSAPLQSPVLFDRPMSTIALACLAFLSIASVRRWYRGLKIVGVLPNIPVLAPPFNYIGVILCRVRGKTRTDFIWSERFRIYKELKNETIAIVPFLTGLPALFTTNLDVAKQVAVGHKATFVKPNIVNLPFTSWGMNLIAAGGQEWRKHRRILGPAFGNSLYRQVWTRTLRTYRQMIESERWNSKSVVEIPRLQDVTIKFALLIISTCGFGFTAAWEDPQTNSRTFSLADALRVVAMEYQLGMFAPDWLLKLPIKKLRQLGDARNGLRNFLEQQVRERKAEIHGNVANAGKSSRAADTNLFDLLIQANETETGPLRLSDSDLIGNMFAFLFAGHESTAHTLAATLGLLAAHHDIQEEIFENINTVIGFNRDPDFNDYGNLGKVLSAFYEAVRMFPPGFVLVRKVAEDTSVTIPNPVGQEGSTMLVLPKGAALHVDIVGLQYNPRYFDEPEKYKPSRWYDMPPDSEMFTAFSFGPRACIGRKFATTEAVCFLTCILRDWRVEPLLSPGETEDQWRTRVLDAKIIITLGLEDIPLRFVRR